MREVEGHLPGCEECRDLTRSVREVAGIFASFETPEPPADLTERILARTRTALLASRTAAVPMADATDSSFWRSLGAGLAAAAVLLSVLVIRPPELLEGWSRQVSQTAHRGYSFGVRTYHRTARWLEDLNVLRITVGVAFENRLDRLNERLRDLEEVRRRNGEEDESSRSGLSQPNAVASRRPALDEFSAPGPHPQRFPLSSAALAPRSGGRPPLDGLAADGGRDSPHPLGARAPRARPFAPSARAEDSESQEVRSVS
jgi:hypothetical protein